ncbi:MAG: shikimate kinase [Clostridia bacterium]|nr:shikimate kinase [Clostridia bacterium]
MKNLVLTGFMGTGKSTVGKILAKKLGYRFVDCDAQIEKEEGKTINEIFALYGENGFRDIESRVIASLSQKSNSVIATGGGAVLRKENIDNLRKNGVVVLLNADIETIVQRLADKTDRPLAKGKSAEELAEKFKSRESFYANNDFAFDVGDLSPMNIADKIIDLYKKL